jgi:putative PIN family toxin of toxin-antitoxin system
MRVVMDTNVFVSALISEFGPPARVLDLWRTGAIELLISLDVLTEYRRVLAYPKIRKRIRYTDDQIEYVLAELALQATSIEPAEATAIVASDPDDDIFIALALAGEADYIVSGDHHLLGLTGCRGLPIIKPSEFLSRFRQSSTE